MFLFWGGCLVVFVGVCVSVFAGVDCLFFWGVDWCLFGVFDWFLKTSQMRKYQKSQDSSKLDQQIIKERKRFMYRSTKP